MNAAYLGVTYLIGAVPVGLIATTLRAGDADLRQSGSGNIGATNVARVAGGPTAATVLALDMLKGLLPVLAAPLVGLDGMAWATAVALAAFLGHCYPVFLEFRGGKGVATGAGAMLALAPIPTLAAVMAWGAALALTGRSSVASLVAAASLIVLCGLVHPTAVPAALLIGVGILVTHTPNLRRLTQGQEAAVVRPVRWGRRGAHPITAEETLTQGPTGGPPAGWS